MSNGLHYQKLLGNEVNGLLILAHVLVVSPIIIKMVSVLLFLKPSLIFKFHILLSLDHPAGFSFYIFSGLIAISSRFNRTKPTQMRDNLFSNYYLYQ